MSVAFAPLCHFVPLSPALDGRSYPIFHLKNKHLFLSKAASLHQSLTDVSVDDINITAGLGDADGEDADDKENDVGHVTDNAGAAGKQATSPAEAAAAAWGGQEHTPRVAHGIGARGVGSGGKGDRGFSSAGGGARASQERARGDYSDGDGDGDKEVDETSKLVFRSVARRPLKEMLRCDCCIRRRSCFVVPCIFLPTLYRCAKRLLTFLDLWISFAHRSWVCELQAFFAS